MKVLDGTTSRRQNALQALFLVTIPCAAFFAVVNLTLGAPVLVFLNLTSLVASFLLRRFAKGASLETAALIYLLTLYANILAALARPDMHPGTTSWVTIIPVASYLLLPARQALPLTIVTLVGASIAYMAGIDIAPYRENKLLVMHVFFPVFGIFIVCHFYTRSQTRTDDLLLERALHDPLTGLGNREKLTRDFESEKKRSTITGMPLSLLLIDLDHFKSINDHYGHDAGDTVLKSFAALLEENMRDVDLLFRFGGEEFAVLLTNTNASDAGILANRLREALERKDIPYREGNIKLTLSAGIAELGRDGKDWQALFHAADVRLYSCKRNGRNCVNKGTSV